MSTAATSKWVPRIRDYANEYKKVQVTSTVTSTHPLGVVVVQKEQPLTSTTLTDPLSIKSSQAEIDPLSRALIGSTVSSEKQKADEIDSFEPWASKKSRILNQYVTTKKISLTTATSSEENNIDSSKTADMVTTTSERVVHRLGQLDALENGEQTQTLSQQEYVNRINEMNREMGVAWKNDQRVKTLKLVIQACKLLLDVNVMEFYPSKFCLVTDLLDNFGKLVYSRLLEKCASPTGKIPERVFPDLVPEATRETTRNWFYKIAIIRELLPRILVEASILKCYSFLSTTEYRSALKRLMRMCRGIGDPLVAAYVRCYLCRVNIDIDFDFRESIEIGFEDLCQSFDRINSSLVKEAYAAQKLTTSQYLFLYAPALDWIVQCLLHKLADGKVEKIIQKAQSDLDSVSGGMILNALLTTLSPEHVRSRVENYAQMIQNSNDEFFPKSTLYRSLGLSLLVSSSPSRSANLQLLNSVWKIVRKFQDPEAYMSCAEVWLELTAKEYSIRELNVMLGDIIKHLKPDRIFENYYPKLYSMIMNVFNVINDFPSLFAMDKMLPFLDLFQRESIRVELFKSILKAFNSKNSQEKTNDPVLITALLHCAKSVHDTLGALSNEDEVREISTIVCSFIRRIDYGKNVEEELKFCVEARGTFGSLDAVTVVLIQKVNNLVVSSHRNVNGVHTAVSSSFVRACLAFCYITIPSLENHFQKLQLYIATAQTAYLCQSLSQGDSLIKIAVMMLKDFPKQIELDGKPVASEKYVYESLSNMLSTLVIAPDNPDLGILYLSNGLSNTINKMKCWDDGSEYRILLLFNVLSFLSTQSQNTLPYHIHRVESNDILYASNESFLQEINERMAHTCDEVIELLKELSEKNPKRQAMLALEFFNRMIAHCDMNQKRCLKFATNLWTLAEKNSIPESQKFAARTMAYMNAQSTKDPSIKALLDSILIKRNETA